MEVTNREARQEHRSSAGPSSQPRHSKKCYGIVVLAGRTTGSLPREWDATGSCHPSCRFHLFMTSMPDRSGARRFAGSLALRFLRMGVRGHVRLEGAASREALATHIADEGLFTRVRAPEQSRG
jgi:hypothetical protein